MPTCSPCERAGEQVANRPIPSIYAADRAVFPETVMAKSAVFDVQKREKTGTAETRRLRKQGLVPGNLYGHGGEPLAFAVSQERIRELFSEGTRVVDVQLGGSSEKALVQELQWDTFSTHVTHIDLIRIDAKQRVQVEISLRAAGVCPGVIAGGSLEQSLRRLEIDCLALEIPEAIQISINELEIGDSITVADLDLPDGVTVLTPESTVVFQVHEPVVLEDEEEEDDAAVAGPIEPEVIGKATEDES